MKTLVFLSSAALAAGQPASSPPPLPVYGGEGSLTLHLENDVFAGSDKGYTNGARLSWISGNRPVEELRGVHSWLRYLIGDASSLDPFQRVSGFADASGISYNYGVSLNQLMFTPEDSVPRTPPAGQRPYAGVLLLGFSLHAMDENVLNTVGLSMGLVGPHAYAEETQDFVHSILGDDKFNGWDTQVPDEFLLNIHLSQKRRLLLLDYRRGAFAIDGFTEIAADIGNYRTAAKLGAVARVGWNLPIEYSDARLSLDAYSHKLFQSTRVLNSRWSFYTTFGIYGNAVAHDVTLDGPWFRDFSTGVDREPLVGELFAGFGVRYTDWEFSYVHTFRSREYDTDYGGHDFGSIAIRKTF